MNLNLLEWKWYANRYKQICKHDKIIKDMHEYFIGLLDK